MGIGVYENRKLIVRLNLRLCLLVFVTVYSTYLVFVTVYSTHVYESTIWHVYAVYVPGIQQYSYICWYTKYLYYFMYYFLRTPAGCI